MNVPALRFPEFSGDWSDIKAGEAFENSRTKGEAGLPLFSVTMNRGLVPRDSLERHMHGNAADETNLRAQPGDVVYNMMRMWQGAAGIAETECMVSPAYVVLSPKEETSSEFFNYRIENARMLYFLWAYSHGLTSDRLRLYYADFARIPMLQPKNSEQKKIAAFLGAVDAKIAALRERRAGLERYKRGLMQELFSQTLRFTKDDGSAFPDWEKRDLSFYLSEPKERNRDFAFSKGDVLSVSGDVGCVNQIEHMGRSYAGVSVKDYHIVRTGDIVYTKSPLKLNPYGIIKANFGRDGIVSTLYAVYRPTASANVSFIHYYFSLNDNLNRYLRPIVRKGAKNDMKVNNTDVLGDPVFFPSRDEQSKIADALSAMDAKIAAVGDQLGQMETFKEGLLQQMFV